ncbi:HD domain-containing protein [Candidatus Desantisbacteria bacterium]|nr:HD domain-containing protein [Candidatus Desantisbacteria bacterium]
MLHKASGLNMWLINERGEIIEPSPLSSPNRRGENIGGDKLPAFCEIINHTKVDSSKFYAETLKKLSATGKGEQVISPTGNLCLIVPIVLKDNLVRGIVSEELCSKNKMTDSNIRPSLPKKKLSNILKDMEATSKLISELCNDKILIKQKNTEIAAINQISKTMVANIDLKDVLEAIVKNTAKTLNAKKCSLRLLDQGKKELVMTVSCGLSKKYVGERHEIKMGNSIIGRVAETGRPIAVEDVRTNNLLEHPQQVIDEGIISMLSVPLLIGNSILGVLTVYSAIPHKYRTDEIQVFSNLAVQSAIAIENKRLVTVIKTNLINITRSLAEAIEAKDIHTRGHCERTAWYAVATARELGMSETVIETIEIATLLHDIGKIGVPENILLKPGGLTQEEFEKVKNHPFTSFKILSSGDFPKEIVTGVSQHHERIDGRGYPNGLSGDEISLEARIIEVADSFEAMVSNRPYRNALDVDAAIMELKRCAGKQFDPKVVDAFLNVLEKRKERFGEYI